MAKNNTHDQSTKEISRHAARLFLQLKDEPLSMTQGWRHFKWLMRSPRHFHELVLIYRHDVQLTRALRRKRTSPRVARTSSKVIRVDRWHGSPPRVRNVEPRSFRSGWTVAAMILMLPVLWFSNSVNEPFPGGSGKSNDASVAIVAKQPRTRTLPDGSIAFLEADATLQEHYTGTHRDVHLQGGALFDVAPDTRRRFVVNTYLVDIASDAATKFAVKMDSSVEVAVYRGMVEVSGHGAKAGAPVIRVKSGETYRVPLDKFRTIMAAHLGEWQALIDG